MSSQSDAELVTDERVLEYIKYLMQRTRLAETLRVLRDGIAGLPQRFDTARRVAELGADMLELELKRELVETPAPFGSAVEQVHG